MRGTRK